MATRDTQQPAPRLRDLSAHIASGHVPEAVQVPLLLTIAEVQQLVPVSRTTLWRRMRKYEIKMPGASEEDEG